MSNRIAAIERTLQSYRNLIRNFPGLLETRFFEKRFADGLLTLMDAERDENSPIVVDFFREVVDAHPSKPLAWQGLFFALGAYESTGDPEEVAHAMGKAMEFGSGYFTPTGQGVSMLMLGDEPDEY